MTAPEQAVQQAVRLATNLTGGHLWRNNSGAMRDDRGRVVRFGLGNDSTQLNRAFKSSDLIGVTPVIIRPEHVGRMAGIFTACEVKRPGWMYRGTEREAAQLAFIEAVQRCGGIAGFVTDPVEYYKLIERWAYGHTETIQ